MMKPVPYLNKTGRKNPSAHRCTSHAYTQAPGTSPKISHKNMFNCSSSSGTPTCEKFVSFKCGPKNPIFIISEGVNIFPEKLTT